MKKYYRGNVESLVVNLKVNDQAKSVLKKRVVIQENVLFYKNFFGVIIRFEDGCPLPTYVEATDYMEDYLSGQVPEGKHYSVPFFDEKRLTPVGITRAEEKVLKMQRKEAKKRIK